jgi:hypothetical protein
MFPLPLLRRICNRRLYHTTVTALDIPHPITMLPILEVLIVLIPIRDQDTRCHMVLLRE